MVTKKLVAVLVASLFASTQIYLRPPRRPAALLQVAVQAPVQPQVLQ
jgi:hypothetical protein